MGRFAGDEILPKRIKMNSFKNIDNQLTKLANRLEGKLTIDRPSYPEALRTFEERRIDWMHNGIFKAIIIHPKFEVNGVNSSLWTFKIVAWENGSNGIRKNSWRKDLIHEQDFSIIENDIQNLIEKGEEELKKVESINLIPISGTYLFLDLDGVLITTPSWKSDEIEKDGYSKFDLNCINNLNELLDSYKFQIWLSSTRRKYKTLEEFNKIFNNRGIKGRIVGFLPVYEDCSNRKEELTKFINEKKITKFIILDDANSLNSLEPKLKKKLVNTNYLTGFTKEKLTHAIEIIKNET